MSPFKVLSFPHQPFLLHIVVFFTPLPRRGCVPGAPAAGAAQLYKNLTQILLSPDIQALQ
jgi:hypothetical protein